MSATAVPAKDLAPTTTTTIHPPSAPSPTSGISSSAGATTGTTSSLSGTSSEDPVKALDELAEPSILDKAREMAKPVSLASSFSYTPSLGSVTRAIRMIYRCRASEES